MSDLSTAASLNGEAAAALAGRPGPRGTSRCDAPGTGSAVGLDIGGTKVLAAFLGPDGVARETLRLPTVRGPQGVVSSAARAVREVVRRAGAELADVDGVGVGVPGLVDPEDGSVMHAVNLGIEGGRFALAEALSAELVVSRSRWTTTSTSLRSVPRTCAATTGRTSRSSRWGPVSLPGSSWVVSCGGA